jgi:hypothetical protein
VEAGKAVHGIREDRHRSGPEREFRTEFDIRDSSFYQVLLKEGSEIEMRLGRIEAAKSIIIRLGLIGFGPLPKATRAAVEATDDLRRLERLCIRILTATSWDDLLADQKRSRPS